MSAMAAERMTRSSLYAAPRLVTDPRECYFYHTFDLPDGGVVPGWWDLRDNVDNYLGYVDLRGKRVLELGTASGFLCFEMEKRGAEVVAYDLSDEHAWDLVPYADPAGQVDAQDLAKLTPTSALAPDADPADQNLPTSHNSHIRMLNNSWWYAHRLLQSKASVVYGSIYEVPLEIGPVDVATFGSILLHLENPFRALEGACRLVTDTVIITEHNCHWPFRQEPPTTLAPPPTGRRARILQKIHDWFGDSDWSRREAAAVANAAAAEHTANLIDELPLALFHPNGELNAPKDTWWYLRANLVRRMLGVLGFTQTAVTYHSAMYDGKPEKLYTVVAKRATSSKAQVPEAGDVLAARCKVGESRF